MSATTYTVRDAKPLYTKADGDVAPLDQLGLGDLVHLMLTLYNPIFRQSDPAKDGAFYQNGEYHAVCSELNRRLAWGSTL